jgi:hypothetical protein
MLVWGGEEDICGYRSAARLDPENSNYPQTTAFVKPQPLGMTIDDSEAVAG